LGIDRVAVLGLSMGTGPALALAAARPDLVTSTTILGGMPPVSARERWSPASRADALYWRLARRAPWLLRRLCAVSAAMMAKTAHGDTEMFISRAEGGLSNVDTQALRETLDDRDRIINQIVG
jgi:pimeloyl-ACP methyl ester carboxylesterase